MLGVSGRTVAVALVIALFIVSPSWLILNDLGVSLPGRPPDFGLLAGETFAVDWMVGSFPIALAVAASIAFVMHVPRLLGQPTVDGVAPAEAGSLRRSMLTACAAGVTAGWLHPWQGI